MSEIKRESPLAGQPQAVRGGGDADHAGITLRERPFLGHLNLRGEPDNDAFRSACRQVLGGDLPMAPNTVAETPAAVVCWLGPNEWLLLTDPDQQDSLAAQLHAELEGIHSALTDVTGGYTLIAVRGPHALDTLAKGCPLDLHPRAFGPGQCAQTLVAKSSAMLRVIEPGTAFEVWVRRSFADYLWQWLTDAGDEYGLAALAPEPALERAEATGTRAASGSAAW